MFSILLTQSHGTVKEVFGNSDPMNGELFLERSHVLGTAALPREGVKSLKKVASLILKSAGDLKEPY